MQQVAPGSKLVITNLYKASGHRPETIIILSFYKNWLVRILLRFSRSYKKNNQDTYDAKFTAAHGSLWLDPKSKQVLKLVSSEDRKEVFLTEGRDIVNPRVGMVIEAGSNIKVDLQPYM